MSKQLSVFEQAYEEMGLDEVIYRLPGDLAVWSLKRRITTPEAILEMLKIPESNTAGESRDFKAHINTVIANMAVADLTKIPEQYHPRLFTWLDKNNTDRLKEHGVGNVSTKLLFNITQSHEIKVWRDLLNKVIAEDPFVKAQASRILDKVDEEFFGELLEKILTSKRPEVRSTVLNISNSKKEKYITEQHLLVGLKAYAKLPPPEKYDGISILDFSLFSQLKAGERFKALQNYLANFPSYQRLRVFKIMPTEQGFIEAIFPNSIQNNEEFNVLLKKYKDIAENEEPKEEEAVEETIQAPAVVVVAQSQTGDHVNASDWYFQDDYLDEDDIDVFTFIRKSKWDSDGVCDVELSEAEVAFLEREVVKAGVALGVVSVGVWRCDGNLVENAVSALKNAGFEKNRCIRR